MEERIDFKACLFMPHTARTAFASNMSMHKDPFPWKTVLDSVFGNKMCKTLKYLSNSLRQIPRHKLCTISAWVYCSRPREVSVPPQKISSSQMGLPKRAQHQRFYLSSVTRLIVNAAVKKLTPSVASAWSLKKGIVRAQQILAASSPGQEAVQYMLVHHRPA